MIASLARLVRATGISVIQARLHMQPQVQHAHDETNSAFNNLHKHKYLPLKEAKAEADRRCEGLSVARREAAEQAEKCVFHDVGVAYKGLRCLGCAASATHSCRLSA